LSQAAGGKRKEKVFIVLDREAQAALWNVCVDKDPQEALDFVLKVIEPQARKHMPCLEGKMGMNMK